MLGIQLENKLTAIRDKFSLIGWGKLRDFSDFMEDVFSFKTPSKPISRTIQINLLYYRQNYMLLWIILYSIFLLFRLCLVKSTFAICVLALVFYMVPFILPKFIYQKLFVYILLVLGVNSISGSLSPFLYYMLVSTLLTLLHAIIRPVTKKSEFSYSETMLYIRVNGSIDDKRDVYINGIAELRMQEK